MANRTQRRHTRKALLNLLTEAVKPEAEEDTTINMDAHETQGYLELRDGQPA